MAIILSRATRSPAPYFVRELRSLRFAADYSRERFACDRCSGGARRHRHLGHSAGDPSRNVVPEKPPAPASDRGCPANPTCRQLAVCAGSFAAQKVRPRSRIRVAKNGASPISVIRKHYRNQFRMAIGTVYRCGCFPLAFGHFARRPALQTNDRPTSWDFWIARGGTFNDVVALALPDVTLSRSTASETRAPIATPRCKDPRLPKLPPGARFERNIGGGGNGERPSRPWPP